MAEVPESPDCYVHGGLDAVQNECSCHVRYLLAQAEAEVQRLGVELAASERRERELLNLIDNVWDQFCLHPDREHPEWMMDGALGVMEDVAFKLNDAGRLERVAERPDKEWWRRPVRAGA